LGKKRKKKGLFALFIETMQIVLFVPYLLFYFLKRKII